jgi:hypothetical protein
MNSSAVFQERVLPGRLGLVVDSLMLLPAVALMMLPIVPDRMQCAHV